MSVSVRSRTTVPSKENYCGLINSPIFLAGRKLPKKKDHLNAFQQTFCVWKKNRIEMGKIALYESGSQEVPWAGCTPSGLQQFRQKYHEYHYLGQNAECSQTDEQETVDDMLDNNVVQWLPQQRRCK